MQVYPDRKTPSESGNVLFVILITVALFAALTFAITRNNKTVSYSSEADTAARVHEILGFAEIVYNAINRVQIEHDCRTAEISFDTPELTGYTNSNSPTSKKCNIFANEGGAISYAEPSDQLLDQTKKSDNLYGQYLFAANVCLDNVGSGSFKTCAGDGVTNEELLMILPWISEEACNTINRILNNPDMIEDSSGSFNETKFTGKFTEGYAIGQDGKTTPRVGCFKSLGSPPGEGYHFYYTLLVK